MENNIIRGKMESLWLLFLVWPLIPICFATKVQFFEEPDFKGYMYETTVSSHYCTNLPDYAMDTLGSLNTTDCVVVCPVLNCHETPCYIIESNVPNLTTLVLDRPIKAYRGCTYTEKREELDVFISRSVPSSLSLEFKDVCTCTNLPKSLRNSNQYLKASSGGKCVQFYAEESCKGKYKTCGDYGNLKYFEGKKIGSFKPCNFSSNCLRMNAVMTKIEPTNITENFQNFATNLPLTAPQMICNNGAATVEVDYSAEKEVKEMFQFEFAEEFSQINSLSFDAGVMIKSNEFFSGNLKSALFEIQNGLLSKYQTNSVWMETQSFGIQRATKFKVEKKISMLPHSEYKVTSFVKVANNVEINYRVEFKISGMIRSQSEVKMKTSEIRGNLRNIKFVRDLDDFTVLAETTAQLKANLGLEVVVDAVGANIDTCSDKTE